MFVSEGKSVSTPSVEASQPLKCDFPVLQERIDKTHYIEVKDEHLDFCVRGGECLD